MFRVKFSQPTAIDGSCLVSVMFTFLGHIRNDPQASEG